MSNTYIEMYNRNPSSLKEVIDALHVLFSSEKVNIEEVQEVLENYKSNEEDWKMYAKHDPYRYTRNLVDDGNGKFNLMLLCWGEGQGSSIHSHANSHCFLKVLDGTLRETMYSWPDKEGRKKRPMKELGSADCHRDDVTYICDEKGLHRVENPSHTNTACSLHVYSPPFDVCQCFDQRTSKVFESKVTFWSKFGERTPFTPGECSVAVIEPENN